MTVKKLYLLPAGRCLVDRSALDTRLSPGELVDLPIWSYLIETTSGPVLVDTGMPESCVADPYGYFGVPEAQAQIVPKMTTDDTILAVLARTGYKPEDLVCIVSTHWHFDHAGGNRCFPRTPIVVQRAEYEAALNNLDYPEDCRDPNLNYLVIEGDYEVVPGIKLLFTPGHAAGHQSVWMETEQSGPILLTIDAAYTKENFQDRVPFAAYDSGKAAESVERLRKLAQATGAQVFFGHDPSQGTAWRTYPYSY